MASTPVSTLAPNAAALNAKPTGGLLLAHDYLPQSSLPTELIQEIFSFLSPSDYDSARLVCQRWYEASLCKPLLRSLLFTMEFDPYNSGCPCFDKPSFYISQPPAVSCPETCPCNYQFPEEPISTWDLQSLRMAFALALDKWPSKVRVSCGKLVVDMSAFLGNYNPDWGYSGYRKEVESLCFSEKSGSFVCTVTKETGKHGEVERKLWIHRLFASKYSPFNNFARSNDGFMFFVEGSRCLPGQLYMTMELTKSPGMPVVRLRVEEHSAFSAVRKIVITYANNKEEEVTFSKFKPDKQSSASDPRSNGTVFYDRKGITYRSSQPLVGVKQQNRGNLRGREKPKPKPKSWASTLLSKKDLVFRKDIVIYAGPPKGTSLANARTSQRLLATIGDETLHQMCYRITVPLSLSRVNDYCSIVVSPQNDIFVCAPSPSSSGLTAQNTESVHARYKFSIPGRTSELARPRITHLTVAPQYFYDFGRGFWWMAICAAYDNGEIWLWRVDMEIFLQKEGANGAVASFTDPLACEESSLPKAPETALTISSCPRNTTVHQAGESSCQAPTSRRVPQKRPGDFDAELGECVSANLCSFSGRTLGDGGSSLMKKVKVLLPSPLGENDGFEYVRAWKLGYMPGLKALNFVGRGRTVLAGTKKEIVVWDMRLWNGFERGKLKAEF